jgi:catechol 2,3-dioxygenase-like lactoylglutathione lyase family enzyme
MQIIQLDHATIFTPRLDETKAFFEQVLGLSVGPSPDFKSRVCWLYAGGRDVVHLVETDTAKQPSPAASINHFALRVEDYDQAVAELTQKQISFRTEETPGKELRQLHVTDPNGVCIELNAPGKAK